METDKNNEVSVNSLLPPGVKEYLSTYNNEEIARKIFSKHDHDRTILAKQAQLGVLLVANNKSASKCRHRRISCLWMHRQYHIFWQILLPHIQEV